MFKINIFNKIILEKRILFCAGDFALVNAEENLSLKTVYEMKAWR